MKQQIILLSLTLAISVGAAFAHKGATGIVKIRMDAMSAIGKNMKSISEMITGKQAFDGQAISKSAAEIADHANAFPSHFKNQIKDKHTEAAPAIWLKPDEFKKQSDDLANFAEALSQKALISQEPSELKASFGAVAGTCKSCHEQFRIKK